MQRFLRGITSSNNNILLVKIKFYLSKSESKADLFFTTLVALTKEDLLVSYSMRPGMLRLCDCNFLRMYNYTDSTFVANACGVDLQHNF